MTDTCPCCLARGIPPTSRRRDGEHTTAAYRCARCGHTWTTSRWTPAYRRTPRRAA